jgi:hypothetical protein
MKQRFYYRNYEPGRWHVFMGNETMQEMASGLLVQEVGHEEAAKGVVREYTEQFNLMRDAEDFGGITENL